MALTHLLQEQNQQLQLEKLNALSDYDYIRHQLSKLENETTNYTAIPKFWRKHIDSAIAKLQETFTQYCHDINRATIRVFIATKGNFKQTEKILAPFLKNIGIKNVEKYVSNVIHAALLQAKNKSQPSYASPSWTPPSPSSTDYTEHDELGIVLLQLSKVPDIDWDMINWELLSDFDKAEIIKKKILREL